MRMWCFPFFHKPVYALEMTPDGYRVLTGTCERCGKNVVFVVDLLHREKQ